MREILFRGKDKFDGEWYVGSLSHDTKYGNCFIEVSVHQGIAKEVIPETVGQYTGLTDKNGTKIFEWDVVRYTFDDPDDPTATENGLKHRIGRVFWSEWRAAFAVTAGRNGSAALNNDIAIYVRGRSIYEYVRGANTVEVIGNIYDNPELMGGNTNG